MTLLSNPLNPFAPRVTTQSQLALRGEVRHPHFQYRVKLQSQGSSLRGRLGGNLFGEELRLDVTGNELLGLMTGNAGRLAVHARLTESQLPTESQLEVRFTGTSGTSTPTLSLARLQLQSDTASGELTTDTSSGTVNFQLSDATITASTSSGERAQFALGVAPRFAAITVALLSIVVSRIVDRAQLESLRGMGAL